jgi:hypothetical protein
MVCLFEHRETQLFQLKQGANVRPLQEMPDKISTRSIDRQQLANDASVLYWSSQMCFIGQVALRYK